MTSFQKFPFLGRRRLRELALREAPCRSTGTNGRLIGDEVKEKSLNPLCTAFCRHCRLVVD